MGAPPYFRVMSAALSLSMLDAVIEAIEDEHEPVYGDAVEQFLETVVKALASGATLVGRSRRPGLDSGFIVARGGTVRIGDTAVELVLNAPGPGLPTRELGVNMRDRRRERWSPYVRLPGDSFDAAYVFLALVGWQNADIDASRALGCEECRRGLIEVDGCGGGRLFTPCSCQGYEIGDEDDVVLEVEETHDDLAQEEPGSWYGTGASWAT
jgi:hypothetical protein